MPACGMQAVEEGFDVPTSWDSLERLLARMALALPPVRKRKSPAGCSGAPDVDANFGASQLLVRSE